MKKLISIIIVVILLQSCGVGKGMTNCQAIKVKWSGYK